MRICLVSLILFLLSIAGIWFYSVKQPNDKIRKSLMASAAILFIAFAFFLPVQQLQSKLTTIPEDYIKQEQQQYKEQKRQQQIMVDYQK